MSALAVWALVVIGAVYFTTESAIFAFLRVAIARRNVFFAMLLYCPACSGFWWGLALSTLFPLDGPARVFASGFAAMGLAATWSKLVGGNPAWDNEASLREPEQHDEATTREATRTEEGA